MNKLRKLISNEYWPKLSFYIYSGIFTGIAISIIKQAAVDILSQDFIPRFTAIYHFVYLVALFAIFALLKTIYDDVNQKFGIKVRYLDVTIDGELVIFSELMKIVNSAKRKIVIVNAYMPEHSQPEPSITNDEMRAKQAMTSQKKKEYYDNLIQKVKNNPGFEYIRIIQTVKSGSGENNLKDILKCNIIKLDHCKNMLEIRNGGNHYIQLLQVNAERVDTFLLADDDKLVWQVNRAELQGNEVKVYLQGVFIIVDEARKITGHIDKYANHLSKGDSKKISVEDLPSIEAR